MKHIILKIVNENSVEKIDLGTLRFEISETTKSFLIEDWKKINNRLEDNFTYTIEMEDFISQCQN